MSLLRKPPAIGVNSVDYNGGLGQIKAQVDSGNVTWDLVVGEKALSEIGCLDSILEKINPDKLPAGADGTPAANDLIEGTIGDCGVGTVIIATVIGDNKSKLTEGPKTIQDYFDLDKFPGKRALRKSADVS